MTGLRVRDLVVRDRAGAALVQPLDLSVPSGGIVSLVGESGAGKSLICAAIAGTLSDALLASGRIWLQGRDASHDDRRGLWARSLFLLPQEPWHALAPARRVLSQTADTPRIGGLTRTQAAARALGLLRHLGLHADRDSGKRAWALSGGMAQRVAVAAAMGAPAPVVLVDEPTKGLDATLRDRVRDSLRALMEAGRAVVLVTHDLELAGELGGELVVMRDGAVVERGCAPDVLARPRHPFTRALVDAIPGRWRSDASAAGAPLVRVEGAALTAGPGGRRLVDRLDLSVARGEIVGLWGASGSGKTTLGDTMLGLRPLSAGTLRWSEPMQPGVRQKLYQDPGAMFAPWRPIRATMADVTPRLGRARGDLGRLLEPLLDQLRLSPALLDRLPHAVSGGELQRLALARTMLARPAFLFADEPTSRLDPLTQRDVAALIATCAADGMAVLLASHNRDLIRALASRTVAIGDQPEMIDSL